MIKLGSLFSGLGGFELGLERAIPGLETIWQVEQEEFCQRVLQKHWPNAEIYNDVKSVGKHNLKPVDIICGGFPCQDISTAGKQGGIHGKKSGLWWEFQRIISELQPRVAIMENVPNLLTLGMPEVLGSLSEMGYDAKWGSIKAANVGATHRRERVFILAYKPSIGWRRWNERNERRCEQQIQTQGSFSKWSSELDDTEHNGCSTTKITGNTRQRSYNDKERSQETSQSKRSSERSNETNSLVNTNSKRRPRRNNGRENAMDVSSSDSRIYGKPRFAPAPNDPAWRDIIRHREDLSPALANYGKYNVENPSSFRWRRGNKGHEEVFYPDKTGRPGGEQKEIESEVRGMANGMGRKLDTIPKVGLLRYLGNGVVPLQATAAFTILYKEKTWKKT